MQNTIEQDKIISLVSAGRNVLVEAGAGTGKSTTLRLIAEANPSKNFLVLCFNAANANESNEHPSKPNNIYYSTIHALAYKEIVNKAMRAELKPYLDYKDISDLSLLKAGLVTTAKDAKDEKRILSLLRKGMQDVVTLYCRGDSFSIQDFAEKRYFSWFSSEEVLSEDEDAGTIKKESVYLTDSQQKKLAELTTKYWLRLLDSGDTTSITHDVYLKLFQLQGYSISSFFDKTNKIEIMLDVLCLDEAQDSNPVAISIFDNSKLQKVVIGDAMQQLYKWRGAGTAMEMYPHFSKAHLSTSFRFNNVIADMANTVLDYANSDMELTGNSVRTEIRSRVHLCRTNASVLQYIFDAAQENSELQIYSNANFKELFSKLYHINALYFGQVPKFPNKALKNLMSKKDLEEALAISPELKQLVKLSIKISSNGNGLYAGIQQLQRHITDDKTCPLTVGTIHSSKGLEWDEVTLDDDFIPITESTDLMEAMQSMLSDDVKLCMLYVAITRAKVKCNLPEYLINVFEE